MRKRIIIILMAAVMMTGCSNALHIGTPPQDTAREANIDAGPEALQAPEESEAVLKPETVQESDAGNETKANSETEVSREPEVNPGPEVSRELEVSTGPEVSREPGVRPGPEVSREPEVSLEAENVPEEMPIHTCSLNSSSTITVLAFGQHEPNCFYGAKYDVKCSECGECLDVVYREPLGHTGNEGVVTCQPDCTGAGSVRYTCIRCGAEWSEAYGQMQPHTWVAGVKKETDWVNGGTKEVPYLYCSVCGKREESE